MQVKWTVKALTNLDDAVEYIAGNNPAANKVAQRIWESSQLLVLQPQIGRPGRLVGTRELVIPDLPYILPYIQKGNTVYILRVMHTSMMWPDKFSE
ncbi:MAG: type II toxin-antitoxin system RelE/ParE family toxin [Desulfobulbaceae bacterium]|nr:type II toxin-antitoxin system RelE/ParE family toxin [Desulfobulbaceae bacterium]